jgi:hypothetical protein
MAKARKGNNVTSRLNILLFGAPFSGKSTMAMQAAYLKRPDGKPFRVLVFDTESSGTDEAIEELVRNGVDADNIYVIYTQSQKEIEEYIAKVANNEDLYMLDEETGDETSDIVLDADGQPFRADCIVIDSISILKTTNQQSLLELSRKRNKIKAERAGATGDEKFVQVSNSALELRDYQILGYSAQNFILSLMSCGAHVIMTAREEDEKVSVKTPDGQIASVATGKKVYSGLKNADYNCKTIIRMYQDPETNEICAEVQKDRSKIHELGEIIVDPTLLDYQAVIDGNKGKKDFRIKNTLDTSVADDQKLFEKQMLGSDYNESTKSDTSSEDLTALKSEIKAAIQQLSPVEKKEIQNKLKEAGLPIAYTKVDSINILTKIWGIVNG